MFDLVKDLLVFGYRATERMEERAAGFRDERKKRMEEFRNEKLGVRERMAERGESRRGELRDSVRTEVSKLVDEAGFATKKEIDELKGLIKDLDAKLNGRAKK